MNKKPELYLNALKKLAENGFEIAENPHTHSTHAYFMYEDKDENTKINQPKKINVVEFVLILPSYNYGYELHIRETFDITKRHTGFTQCKTQTLSIVDLGDDLSKYEDDDLAKRDNSHAITLELIDGIINTAISIANEFADDKVLLMFDTFVVVKRESGEEVEAKLVDYMAREVVCYCDEETNDLYDLAIAELNYVIQKLD